ncbi:MAG TPA: hypothetical protein VHU84_02905, partial [Lacipirellulaceae bacterium]|nr:hypothetical protein [Lacipirellulaceae bacterium]
MRGEERGARSEKNWVTTVCALVVLVVVQARAFAFSLDDITYWVGSGSNRAALAIDWQPGTTQP